MSLTLTSPSRIRWAVATIPLRLFLTYGSWQDRLQAAITLGNCTLTLSIKVRNSSDRVDYFFRFNAVQYLAGPQISPATSTFLIELFLQVPQEATVVFKLVPSSNGDSVIYSFISVIAFRERRVALPRSLRERPRFGPLKPDPRPIVPILSLAT